MNKKGYTLVELMITISIIGILAAIAMPQFGNAVAKARAAVVPLNLNKIKRAQEAYRVEAKHYLDNRYWGYNGNDTYSTDCKNSSEECLGLALKPTKFFGFNTQTTDSGFHANAKLLKDLKKAKADVVVTLDQDSKVTVHEGNSESRNAMKSYLRAFINQTK